MVSWNGRVGRVISPTPNFSVILRVNFPPSLSELVYCQGSEHGALLMLLGNIPNRDDSSYTIWRAPCCLSLVCCNIFSIFFSLQTALISKSSDYWHTLLLRKAALQQHTQNRGYIRADVFQLSINVLLFGTDSFSTKESIF